MSIKILIADDHQIICNCLRDKINKQPDMKMVAEAKDGRTAVKIFQELKPDVIIMDITMPYLNGIDATHQIIAQCPTAKILVLSIHADKRFVEGMLNAGASGYLTKNCTSEELMSAIRIVSAGKTYFSPEVSGITMESLPQSQNTKSSPFSFLSIREREVLQLLAEGNSINQISSQLSLSIKTVYMHQKNIKKKLKINSVAEITKYAIRTGLTSLDY